MYFKTSVGTDIFKKNIYLKYIPTYLSWYLSYIYLLKF